MSEENPYVTKPVLHMDGSEGSTIKCRKHPSYSPRTRLPTCLWCLALFYMVKSREGAPKEGGGK